VRVADAICRTVLRNPSNPMILLLLLLLLLAFSLTIALITFFRLRDAPVAYENEDAFYYGVQPRQPAGENDQLSGIKTAARSP